MGVDATSCGSGARQTGGYSWWRTRVCLQLGTARFPARPSSVDGGKRMPCEAKTFYESPNGDRWLIARDPETDRIFIRHEANLPSGGHVTDMEVSRFLATEA